MVLDSNAVCPGDPERPFESNSDAVPYGESIRFTNSHHKPNCAPVADTDPYAHGPCCHSDLDAVCDGHPNTDLYVDGFGYADLYGDAHSSANWVADSTSNGYCDAYPHSYLFIGTESNPDAHAYRDCNGSPRAVADSDGDRSPPHRDSYIHGDGLRVANGEQNSFTDTDANLLAHTDCFSNFLA